MRNYVLSMLQQTFAVFLVLGLLGAALWLLKRQGLARLPFRAPGLGSRRRLRLVERLALTPQHSLHLVSIDGRLTIFAASPQSCQPVPVDALPAMAVNEALAEQRETAASC